MSGSGLAVAKTADLRKVLEGWAYEPESNVRLAQGADGREIMLVRQPMGLDQYEVNGRPDGQRPHAAQSALDFHLSRHAEARRTDGGHSFALTPADCAELFAESALFHHRAIHFFRLEEWQRAERDTAHNLRLMDLVRRYALLEEDRTHLEQWRLGMARMHAIARALRLLESERFDDACKIACDGVVGIEAAADGHLMSRAQLTAALLRKLDESLAAEFDFRPHEESVFTCQGDFWTVIYDRRMAHFKATRGLQCLAFLLRHPGSEFHVRELLARLVEEPMESATLSNATGPWQAGSWDDAGPILDPQAKAEYRRRLSDLRGDLEDAERCNDLDRAARAEYEITAIAHELASAVGLGGRDRRSASDAERARSAVTKRIREAIGRIADVIPTLGQHLSARIRTGYFCSYNPHPDRLVAWKF